MAKKIILLLVLIFLTAANSEAAPDNDLTFEPVLTTYAENDSAALSIIRMKDTGELCFLVADNKAQIMGFGSVHAPHL